MREREKWKKTVGNSYVITMVYFSTTYPVAVELRQSELPKHCSSSLLDLEFRGIISDQMTQFALYQRQR